MKHALVVGGTGMLAPAVHSLVKDGFHVTVIGRNANRMNNLMYQSAHPEQITPLLVDYANEVELKERIEKMVEKNGPFTMIVAWIHSYAERALDIIIRSNVAKDWTLLHVLGSSADAQSIRQSMVLPMNGTYCQVQLGFVQTNHGTRWLTNEEIAKGVIEAIHHQKSFQQVGLLAPLALRPR